MFGLGVGGVNRHDVAGFVYSDVLDFVEVLCGGTDRKGAELVEGQPAVLGFKEDRV